MGVLSWEGPLGSCSVKTLNPGFSPATSSFCFLLFMPFPPLLFPSLPCPSLPFPSLPPPPPSFPPLPPPPLPFPSRPSLPWPVLSCFILSYPVPYSIFLGCLPQKVCKPCEGRDLALFTSVYPVLGAEKTLMEYLLHS